MRDAGLREHARKTSPLHPYSPEVAPAARPEPEPIRVVYNGAPVSQNAAYKRSRQGRMYLSAPAVAYKRDLALCARLAMQGRPPIEGPYSITIRPFFPSRRFDLASVEKLTSDALQGVVVSNDRFARRIVLEWNLDRDHPRVEIEVTPAPAREGER